MHRSTNCTIAFALTAFCTYAAPHGGRTDSRGGHNGPNGYHFHNGGAAAVSSVPVARPLITIPSTNKRKSEVKSAPKTVARTEARTAPPGPKYKQFTVGPKLEFQLISSSSNGTAFKGKIQIISPKSGIEFTWLREVPAQITNIGVFTIHVLLPNQSSSEPDWAVIENAEGGARIRIEHHKVLATFASDPQRQWTDTTGKFTREGRLWEIAEGEVLIKLKDGKELWIPIEKLCAEDKDHVSERLSKSREAN